jgi:glycosyltransferase involved in cell wall biosynthesis
MKVLLVHNHYCLPGGEDEVFHRERELLRAAGHEVLEYTRHNGEFEESGFLRQAKVGLRSVWARDSTDALRALLRSEKPDVVHFHNTFPLVSPAAYHLCHQQEIPAVQSLHNPRLMCPAATCYRDGEVCEDCSGRTVAWPGVVHACYHKSHLQTAMIAGMLTAHRLLDTWQSQVDAYVVFTEFFRQKFITAGLPREKIFLKPHFLTSDPGMKRSKGDYAVFLGRLAPEKGVATLLNAWRTMKHIPLWIQGQGPMEAEVLHFAEGNPSIRLLRRLPRGESFEVIKGARFLVWPSEGYYESFGLVAIEAFACGVPVIASRIGAMMETVEDGKTGLHFAPGDAQDLAAKVEWAWTHSAEMDVMGARARVEYESKYTAEQNYPRLLEIYRRAQTARAA